MSFRTIRFHGFRNLEDGEVNIDARNIYLIGENGQGKTNFLEALYFLSYGSSFRTRQDGEMISWHRKDMSVHGLFYSEDEIEDEISIVLRDGGKEIRLHGKSVTDRKELIRRIPAIVFVHDDFLFVSGPPEKRRWFMDQTLSLHDPLYVDQLRRYKKLLKERNYLLRRGQRNLIDHYGEQLAYAGLALSERRDSLVNEFGRIFSPLFREVSGFESDVILSYRPSWGEAVTTGEVMDKLSAKLEMDLAVGSTGSGPHRDRFLFQIKERDFAKSASTGQLRLLSLVLRVAQARFFSDVTGRKPILLLDDVLLELDPAKRRLFREKLPQAEQIFYTFLPGEETRRDEEESLIYKVKDGCLHESTE